MSWCLSVRRRTRSAAYTRCPIAGAADLRAGFSRIALLRNRAQALARIARESPYTFRLPEPEEYHCYGQGGQCPGYVHQIAVYFVRPQELCRRKRNTHDKDCRKHLKGLGPSDERADQPERDNDRGYWKDAADCRAQVRFRQSRYGSERMDGRSDGAPSNRRRVGDQVKHCGVKRLESKADHEGAGYSNGRAEAGGALDKRAK